MIAGLARDIDAAITLNWLDKKHALVFPGSVMIPNGNSKVKQTLPFEWGTETCINDKAVTPDEKYRAVSWLEAGPVAQRNGYRLEGGMYVNAVDFRMVCWLNLKKIHSTDQYVGDKCVQTLEQKIASLKFETADFKVLGTDLKFVQLDAKNILSKYTFDDRIKLTIYPYFIFAIDFHVGFTQKHCGDVTLLPC